MQNRRIVLASRPEGPVGLENFRLETAAVPRPGEGELLLRTRWLSLDPYMRGRMSAARSYAPPVEVGAVMVGGTVSEVVEARAEGFAPGDLVLSSNGWQDYAIARPGAVTRLDGLKPPSYALGVLGMPGFTAWHGLLQVGRPRAGETVVVAAATGAVGSVVGQIARIRGCRAVGIAGGADKGRHAVETLGFDACVDHRDPDFRQKLKEACPEGIDVYFENVGGKVLDMVLPRLNDGARIPVCGVISAYNAEPGDDGLDASRLLRTILVHRVAVQGFLINDHAAEAPAFRAEMQAWLDSGQVRYAEHRVQGLEAAPQAFLDLLQGRHIGKVVVEA
jgi:NADPH-dependent curcumin reductase CurA